MSTRQLRPIHQCHYKTNSEQEDGQQRTLAVQAKVENIEFGSSQLAEPGRIQFSGTSWKMYPRRLKVRGLQKCSDGGVSEKYSNVTAWTLEHELISLIKQLQTDLI